MANLRNDPDTSIQGGLRPVVVVSNNKANTYSTVLTVVPLTTRIHKKTYLPTHVFIHKNEMSGLNPHGMILAEQLTSVDLKDVIEKCGSVSKRALTKITKAVSIQLGIGESRYGRKSCS